MNTATATPPSKPTLHDPVKISARLKLRSNHFIIYPTTRGYCFATFYRSEDKDPFEIVARNHRPYRTKTGCIRVMKKILDGFGTSLFLTGYFAYDHRGNRISLKIEYDVKKLL